MCINLHPQYCYPAYFFHPTCEIMDDILGLQVTFVCSVLVTFVVLCCIYTAAVFHVVFVLLIKCCFLLS